MNMKHVELQFRPYLFKQDPVSMSVFVSQLKDHYSKECYSNKQVLRILSSVGLLGNLNDTYNNFKVAFSYLLANPFSRFT